MDIGTLSDVRPLLSGVPQNSDLGLLVFPMCTRRFVITVPQYGVKYHSYANRTQLYTPPGP